MVKMATHEINYQSLNERNPFRSPAEDDDTTNEIEDAARNSDIIIHVVPETNKARWNHIEDLDSFFTRMYNYHQKHGFNVIVMNAIFQLFQFGFAIWLLTFTVNCIRYPILFGNVRLDDTNRTKVTLGDVVIPIGECASNFGLFTYTVLIVATLYFMVRLTKSIYLITQYWDIKKFYNTALHIEDNDLDDITWHEIKKKIREVQAEQHMCIDKEQLTDLDIYHRILRFKNYMVALMNKNLLPVSITLPILNYDLVCLSRGLLFNIDFILFRCPGSPFQNNWQLRDDYAVRSNQMELAERLKSLIFWVALANFFLTPVLLCWQIIYILFTYANILRKEPGALGARTWSNYGRLYLRHFNELDHELDSRLNRAYEYSDRYLSSFSSPTMSLIAKNILFITGGILVVVLTLGIYDEYVFQVEHVLTIVTGLTALGYICRTLIPDENLIWCPEQLMTAILAHVHYIPSDWKNQAHTVNVRKEFGKFFQFKADYLFNEMLSPILTPFVLIFVFRPKALEIVKFFRSFTVTVRGVGNVCSFAQMDVRKHGNPEWQLQTDNLDASPDENKDDEKKKSCKFENGNTELSLVRFTLTNPEWQMPTDASNFIKGIRENARKDLMIARKATNNIVLNPITESLVSFGTLGDQYSSLATSVFTGRHMPNTILSRSVQQDSQYKVLDSVNMNQSRQETGVEDMQLPNFGAENAEDASLSQYMATSVATLENMRKMHVSKIVGRLEGPSESLLYSLYGEDAKWAKNPTGITVADMCLSTLYLHELHRKNKKSNQQSSLDAVPGTSTQRSSVINAEAAEKTPLLRNVRS